MKNRKTKSGLLLVGAAAGAAAVTWLNRRRLALPESTLELPESLVEPEGAESVPFEAAPLSEPSLDDVWRSLAENDARRRSKTLADAPLREGAADDDADAEDNEIRDDEEIRNSELDLVPHERR